MENETPAKHEIAALLMSGPLCFYKDAYSVGLFHARKLLALDPNNYKNKEFLLLFHDIPERLIQKEEAIKLAQDILEIEPSNFVAHRILRKYGIN